MKRIGMVAILSVAVMSIVALGLWAGGAAEPAVPEDTLIVAYPDDVATFDSMITTAPPKEVRHLVFESLYAFDIELVPRPHLARSAEVSDDQLTWTFHLRDNVQFHDGQPMTAEDVVASFERFRQVGARAWELERVREVVAIDDHTVEFRLSSPLGSILESLGGGGGCFHVYPKWVIDEIGTDELVEHRHIVGTGPYMIEQIVHEERYVLRRFDDYTQPGGEPSYLAGNRYAPIERMDIRVIPDNATRVAALEAGDVDLIQAVPLDDARRVEQGANTYTVVGSPGYRVYYKFNVRQGPFTDPLLREAVRMAFDPEELMLAIGDSEFWIVNHAMRYEPDQWMWSDYASQFYKRDLAAARELVAQSDYDGELIRFLASPGRAFEYRTVVPMERVLRDLGLNVDLQSVDAATFSSLRAQLDQWEIKHAGGISTVGPVYLSSGVRDRTGEFWPGVPDEWHELMDIVEAESDREIRAAAIERLHVLHAEMNYELWIGSVFEVAGARNNVKNVPPWIKVITWNIEKE